MLNVFAIIGQGNGFQPGRLFAPPWTGVVPAGQQPVGREPVGLMLIFRLIDKIGRCEDLADPLAHFGARAPVGASIEQ
ncbi:hypothetical protein D3C85_1623510 [compost metagenome]